MAEQSTNPGNASTTPLDIEAEARARGGEAGMIFWISLLLGTVATLPTLSGVMDGKVSPVRGAMWFLVTTLIALVGVWTVAWLMHVFSDPYPDETETETESETVSEADDRAVAPTPSTGDPAPDATTTGAGASPASAPPAMADSATP